MTCAHVLGLIDAGPFADYPRAHREAAARHARGCPTCGPALDAANALTLNLAALPGPVPPPDMSRAVMARIERVEEVRSATAAAPGIGHSSAWVTGAAALAATLAIFLLTVSGERPPLDAISPRVGGLAMPPFTVGAVAIAAGLALYIAGLFAPLGRERDRFRQTRNGTEY